MWILKLYSLKMIEKDNGFTAVTYRQICGNVMSHVNHSYLVSFHLILTIFCMQDTDRLWTCSVKFSEVIGDFNSYAGGRPKNNSIPQKFTSLFFGISGRVIYY